MTNTNIARQTRQRLQGYKHYTHNHINRKRLFVKFKNAAIRGSFMAAVIIGLLGCAGLDETPKPACLFIFCGFLWCFFIYKVNRGRM